LNDLFRRGLTGEGVALAVCDGGAGLLGECAEFCVSA
jgi:hypothetical protein